MSQEWKLVPVEPTAEMLAAGEREHAKSPTNANPYHKYAAMIAAAPAPPAGEVEVLNDACRQRFTTWIDQKMGGAMLGEVVVAEYHDATVTRLQAENAALQQRLNVADEQVDILSGGLRLMTSFGSGTNIAGVKTVAKQTLNRAAGVAHQSAPAAKGGE